jgi:hypothetical protein
MRRPQGLRQRLNRIRENLRRERVTRSLAERHHAAGDATQKKEEARAQE